MINEKRPMNSLKGYTLAEGVQVRSEIFGLLFYDYRGPRLYFVPTKELLPDTFFDGKQSIEELTESICTSTTHPRKGIEAHVTQALEMLEQKGLIYGKSIR